MSSENYLKIKNAKIDEIIQIKDHSWLKSVMFDLTTEGIKKLYSFKYYSKLRDLDVQFPMRTSQNVMEWKTLTGAKGYFIKHFMQELI